MTPHGGGQVGEARRDRGTGSTPRWRAWDGRWEARVTLPNGTVQSFFSRTPGRAGEREVTRKRDAALRDASWGISPETAPLAVYVERYLARRAVRLAPESVARYRRALRHLQEHRAGRVAVSRLRAGDLDGLYADLLAKGMAPKGIELVHTLVVGALGHAQRRRHVLVNEATLAERPPVRKPHKEAWDAAELRRLCEAGRTSRLGGLVVVGGTLGLRRGELLALRRDDLDPDHGTLTLRTPEKGGRPRVLPLPAIVVEALREHLTRQKRDRIASGGAWNETGLLFTTQFGERLPGWFVTEEFDRIVARAGVRKLGSIHALRHSAVSLMAAEGVDNRVIAEIVGHRSTRTTDDTYTHVSGGMVREAVERLGRAVSG